MLFCTPDASPVFKYLSGYLGIEEGGISYTAITGMELEDGFMLGSKDFNFHWGEPMLTALDVRLKSSARVYARSDDRRRVPLVWSADCGKGRWVVMNHGFAEKATRGLTCAAYSLMEDISVWPVINASAFFLDDFPVALSQWATGNISENFITVTSPASIPTSGGRICSNSATTSA